MRSAVDRLRALWRHSLQFRTVAVTLALSTLAILIIGLSLLYSVSQNLTQSGIAQARATSEAARANAQAILEASDATDRAAVQSAFSAAVDAVIATAGTSDVALRRVPGESSSFSLPLDRESPVVSEAITPELREAVQQNPGESFSQSVSLAGVDGPEPGVIVASDLVVSGSTRYELYIGYSLAEAQETLSFMQLVGGFGAIALILILGAITLVVVRFVIDPIRTAADTSRRLAAGELDVRLPERGEDELSTLARSFNDMAESLQDRIGELAHLSTMQQRFVSDVSHELRTPLTTIRLAGDVLHGKVDEFDPTTARTVELLHTQTERFELLLADLLEISRYDAGSVELASEPTNLVHLAGDAIESMRTLAAEHGSEIELRAPGGHLDAEVDPRRVRRIVRNLLGNAIEHGEGRPILVSVDSTSEAVALSVRDHGIGMTPEDAARVFDRFWRADPSRTRRIGGSGLGLAISMEDAVAHGGLLDVWSSPGEGSVFRLTIPRRAGLEEVRPPLLLGPDDEGEPIRLPRGGAA
ncbi:HAMP domain-containing protein [Agromyces sp. MMS17-SY077]|uniref:Sensor histidine kinase MtrB n=1 Tax=Agromyces seonyuensis TaxID=2662446 RepID=A0A6I4P1Q1_9MICO|nr:HAMP domain-containing protein [Agromyces seonyuensis]